MDGWGLLDKGDERDWAGLVLGALFDILPRWLLVFCWFFSLIWSFCLFKIPSSWRGRVVGLLVEGGFPLFCTNYIYQRSVLYVLALSIVFFSFVAFSFLCACCWPRLCLAFQFRLSFLPSLSAGVWSVVGGVFRSFFLSTVQLGLWGGCVGSYCMYVCTCIRNAPDPSIRHTDVPVTVTGSVF